ncbi:MAG: bifunctional phosphoribosyl-AMP cyclohydrolase/phosphoribosyl-ATP diphosphatase [Chloroflexi bacterium]|nr:bifunctional phosphoribosyl-AMP cyclohydrolase/phosphoribosyl-ATP diphosphatase [Chloroflexota bacterium]
MSENNNLKLIPAIIQDHRTLNVLMLGYMNQESIDLTLKTKKIWFYSRSRNKLWQKGETSGNFLNLKQLVYDCDKDAILATAIPDGPTCHNGTYSCFEGLDKNHNFLYQLINIINQRNTDSKKDSYTSKLLHNGIPKIAQKIVEEAGELSIASLGDDKKEVIYEFADLLFHMLVLLEKTEINIEEIWSELASRNNEK